MANVKFIQVRANGLETAKDEHCDLTEVPEKLGD
jgi:hypothetical protein